MKVLERIIDGVIRDMVSIDESQFGFVPGRGTHDWSQLCSQTAAGKVPGCEQEAIYGVRRLRESL